MVVSSKYTLVTPTQINSKDIKVILKFFSCEWEGINSFSENLYKIVGLHLYDMVTFSNFIDTIKTF